MSHIQDDDAQRMARRMYAAEAVLTAANERIRELEHELDVSAKVCVNKNAELIAERKVSDKLKKALKEITEIEDLPVGGDWEEIQHARNLAEDALAEVATIRASKSHTQPKE